MDAILCAPSGRCSFRQHDVSVSTFSLPTLQVCTVAVNALSLFITSLFRFHRMIDPAERHVCHVVRVNGAFTPSIRRQEATTRDLLSARPVVLKTRN
jgi:hypothetical protein